MLSIRTWDHAFHWSTYASVFAATLGIGLLAMYTFVPDANVTRIVAVKVTPGPAPVSSTPTPLPVAAAVVATPTTAPQAAPNTSTTPASKNAVALTGSLLMSSATASVATGQTYVVTITAKSGSMPVNAVQADITYPVSKLQLVGIDGNSSGFIIQAASSGKNGLIKIARATIQPLTGDQNVSTLTFKAIGAGNASVSFSDDSSLITADTNQNIAGTKTAATVVIQ